MSHRDLRYLNNNRIIYRRYSSDIPTSSHNWGWYYADGTHGYYALFNNKAKINTIRSLKWHLLTLWYLNLKLINKIVEDVFRQDLDAPPKNRLRKVVFKDSSGLTTIEKLKIVGQVIGQAKGIKQDDIYEAMLYIHENQLITIPRIAETLKCTTRTIYRHMSKELKEEKQLLNKQYEKI